MLTKTGLAEAAQRESYRAALDGMEPARYLDRSGSVSALVEVEDDFEYDPDHIMLNHRVQLLQMEIF